MSRLSLKARLFGSAALTLLAMAALPGVAQAQQPIPPEHYTLDARSVDLVTGQFNYATSEVVIGQPGAGGLAYGRIFTGVGSNTGWRDTLLGTINVSGAAYTVSIGAESEVFTNSGATFTPVSNNGSTLTQSGNTYTFTSSTGAVASFFNYYANVTTPYRANAAILDSWTAPNGDKLTYNYSGANYCRMPTEEGGCEQYGSMARLQSVTNNRGYQIHYDYASDDPESGPYGGGWLTLAAVTGINMAEEYCNPFAGQCTLTRTSPKVAYGEDGSGHPTVTDELNRTTTYTEGYFSGLRLTGVKLPGASGNQVTVGYNSSGQATAITDATGAWIYGYSTSGTTRTTTSSGPQGQSLTAVSNLTIGRATSVTQATSTVASSTWSWLYDSQQRLKRTTNPEGDYSELTYDGRGNVTQVTATSKPGSGLAAIVTSASYPSTCSNIRTCNSPDTTTDARGNVTNYTWDSTHGGLLTVTLPKPTPGADRPQTRYAYGAFNAYVKNNFGAFVAMSPAVTLPTEVSACASGTSCIGGANEVRTTIAYGSASVANNLAPTSVSQGSGANPSMTVTAMTWTPNGDIEMLDGPLSGSADTTWYRYDDARQPTGVIGPDPDGGGAGLNRAQRISYSPRGQVILSETGATPGYTDPNWTSFSPLLRSATVYDDKSRPVVASQQSGAGTPIGVQQVSYDASGRPECTAVRMNPAAWGSLPTSACTATTAGSDGPDRITRTTYDAADRPLSATTAFGLTEAATTTLSYTANGQGASLTDGNGNVSIQTYDGFDRPATLRYPNPTGGGTSTTDYQQVAYDVYGRMNASRNRAGRVTTLTLDALGRVTAVDAPVGTMGVAFTYDNLDRVLTSIGSGQTLTNAWDPLSRLTSEGGPLGAMSYQYDAAGSQTRITWPDGFYAQYDHDPYGEVTAIRENGATSGAGVLATYAYNNLGQPTGIARGNGTATAYGYDAAGRMTGLSHDMAGSAYDVTFGYGYNPAGQIASRTVSNAAYVYAPATGSTSYANDGLNRMTSVGGGSVTYDANQNINGVSGNSYVYDEANRLVTATIAGIGYAFGYDPDGRLYSSPGGYFQYVGAQLAGEYDGSGALVARHVPGPGLDQPVATFSGSARIQQIADERGSVLGVQDAGGSVNINRYDEYGVASAANRFQYTGQAWMAPGLYNYRARAYAPELGRFLQADPIGYAAGTNVYAYVGGDPLNLVDPFGLCGAEHRGTTSDGNLDITGHYKLIRCAQGTAGSNPFKGEGRAGGSINRPEPTLDEAVGLDDVVVTGQRIRRLSGHRIVSASPDRERELQEAYEADNRICGRLRSAESRRRCYQSANQRNGNRRAGRPIGPLDRGDGVARGDEAADALSLGVVLYWIISEGSRIVFPLRNLVPVP